MKSEHLKQLIDGKRAWTEPLTPQEEARGFKGWYSSKYLPHFDSPGAQQFITFRLADALPASRCHEWKPFLAIEDKLETQRQIEAYIDRGYGKCYLRDPRVAEMVQSSFWHSDGQDYRLLAWVIMPNHVHLLIEVWQNPLRKILQSIKSYTARVANEVLRRAGVFWKEDYFDRYIRDEGHFRRVVRYIENNPVKARLARTPQDWRWSSAAYRSIEDRSGKGLTQDNAKRVPTAP